MSKHKEVKKWVAMVDHPIKGTPVLLVEEVTVIETDKQLRLKPDGTKQYRTALRACCLRTTFDKKSQKKSPCNLFDSEKEAVDALLSMYERKVELAEASVRATRRDLLLVRGFLNESAGDSNQSGSND